MKRKYYFNKRAVIYTSLLCWVISVSCNKYLDKNPDTRTDLSTVSKVSEFLATAYPSASYIPFTESMSDNADDKGVGIGDYYQDMYNYYTFTDFESNSTDTPESYWDEVYAAIAVANQALASISAKSDSLSYNSQKGEALLCRAYGHFMLVNLFAKTYNSNTANSDPGIPYVTTPETVVFKKYDRGTVQQDYDLIEKDISEGLPLINNAAYSVPSFHFNVSAANAFASRFFLFKKDYKKCVYYADMVFSDQDFASNMRPWLTDYQTMTSDEIKTDYANSTNKANLLIASTHSLWARKYRTVRFGFTRNIKDNVIPKSNVTGNSSWAYRTFTNSGTDNIFVPKWIEFFYAPTDPNFGTAMDMIPLFSTEEVLLNRAEALAQLGSFDSCIADLNLFASQRLKNYNAGSNSITTSAALKFYDTDDPKEALTNTVLDFKRAEFVEEGLRWFDDLRYNIPITHYIRNASMKITDSVVIKADDLRRVLQLPQSVSLAGLSINPR